MTAMRSLLALTVAIAIAACGGDETASGKGGFVLGGSGGGGSGGGGCSEGAACAVDGALGACAGGTIACEGGAPTCVAKSPAGETCDGVDQSCDGTIDEGCGLDFEAFAADGTSIAVAPTMSYPVNGSATLFAESVLGASIPDGWLRVTSLSPLPLGGTTASLALAETSAHVLSPTLTPTAAVTSAALPYYRQGDAGAGAGPVFDHTLSIVNPGAAAASVTLTVFPGDASVVPPVVVPIAAHGALRTSVAALFALDAASFAEGWVSVASDQPVLLAYVETKSNAADAAGDAGWPAAATSLVVPYFVSGPLADTDLRLSTAAETSVTVTVRAHRESGPVLEATVDLGALGSAAVSLGPLFGFVTPVAGWLEVTATGPVSAVAILGEGASGGMAMLSPADALDTLHWVASAKVDAATGERTDLALANPGVEAAAVTLQAFAADGSPVAQTSVVLAPGGAKVASLDALLGVTKLDGWVRVASNRPITGAYAAHDAAPGVGVTRLLHGLSNEAVVPDLRSLGGGSHTGVTLIQPERRLFAP